MKSRPIVSSLLLLSGFAPSARAASFSVPFRINPSTRAVQIACETESLPGKVLRCTIDTGAQRSTGSSAAVSGASIVGAAFVEVLTPAGTQVAHETQQTLIVGDTRISVSLEVIPNIRRLDADILIGEDFLQQFSSVTIDYKNHVVTFETK